VIRRRRAGRREPSIQTAEPIGVGDIAEALRRLAATDEGQVVAGAWSYARARVGDRQSTRPDVDVDAFAGDGRHVDPHSRDASTMATGMRSSADVDASPGHGATDG